MTRAHMFGVHPPSGAKRGDGASGADGIGAGAVGKSTRVEQLPLGGAPSAVQRREAAGAGASGVEDTDAVKAAAAHGTAGVPGRLPYRDTIQRAFGRHDVSRIGAHFGGAAADGAARIGAEAYAVGDRVAFASAPTLHTAAHEAAHVIQQRAGVQLKGGVGAVGDAYERHADAVADRVVEGRSAEELLDGFAPSGATGSAAVQRKVTVDGKERGLESFDKEIAPTKRAQQILGEMILADPTYAFKDDKEVAAFVADLAKTEWGEPPTNDKLSHDQRVIDFTKQREGQHLWASDHREPGDLRVTRTDTLNEMFRIKAGKAGVLGQHKPVGTTPTTRPKSKQPKQPQEQEEVSETQHVYSAMMTSLSPAANDKEREEANKDVHGKMSVMNCEQFVAYSLWGGGVIKDWELALIFAACAQQNNMAFLYQAMGFNAADLVTTKNKSLGLTDVCVLFEVNKPREPKQLLTNKPVNTSKQRIKLTHSKQLFDPTEQKIELSKSKQRIKPIHSKQLFDPTEQKIELSKSKQLFDPTHSKQRIEPTTSNQRIDLTEQQKIEPTTSNQLIEPTTSNQRIDSTEQQKIEPITSNQRIDPLESKEIEPITSNQRIDPLESNQLIEQNQQIELNQPPTSRARTTPVSHMLLYTGGAVVELNSGTKSLSEWQAATHDESVYADRILQNGKLIYACPVAAIPKQLQLTLAEIATTFRGGELLAPKQIDQPTESHDKFGFLKFQQK